MAKIVRPPKQQKDRVTHHAISVDVEDYFQVWALSEVIDRSEWDDFALRVEHTTRRTLDLFDKHETKATFFTLGWVAERCPVLLREIAAAGHEIASHGYEHVKVFDQTPDQFRQDAARTKTLLEDITGTPVNGYRAAGFSIDQRTPWAAQILADIGYQYSSSLHPIAHDHYGMPDAPRFAHQPLVGEPFLEIPVSTVDLYGRRISCAGGGWFRAMPYQLSSWLIKKMIRDDHQPAVFYFHPWEIDPQQPRVEGLSMGSKFRHYLNLTTMEDKLDKLLGAFTWDRIDQVFGLEQLEQAA